MATTCLFICLLAFCFLEEEDSLSLHPMNRSQHLFALFIHNFHSPQVTTDITFRPSDICTFWQQNQDALRFVMWTPMNSVSFLFRSQLQNLQPILEEHSMQWLLV